MEEKPDVTYNDLGGCKEQIEKLKEVVETPLLHVSLRGGLLDSLLGQLGPNPKCDHHTLVGHKGGQISESPLIG